jgi:hypothetical protein
MNILVDKEGYMAVVEYGGFLIWTGSGVFSPKLKRIS